MADNEQNKPGAPTKRPEQTGKPAAGRGGKQNPNAARRARNRGNSAKRENKPSRSVSTNSAAAASGTGGSGLATALAVIALLISVGLGAAGYFVWQEVQRQGAGQEKVADTVGDRYLELQSEARKSSDEVRQEVERLRGRLESSITDGERRSLAVEQAMTQLREQMGRTSDGWKLAEVRYLMRIANQQLNLQGDVLTSLAALEAADVRLRGVGDPGLAQVRELLASEIAKLKAVEQPDIEGIVAKLRGFHGQVEQLKLEGTEYQPPAPSGTPGKGLANVDLTGDWRELPGKIWDALRELVAVRHHDKPVGPMLAPDKQVFLYQNLHLQLEAATLSALRGEQSSYDASLARIKDWLEKYFDPKDAATVAMLSGMDSISGIRLKPSLPDISSSLRLLRQQMELEAATAPAPVASEAEPAETSPAGVEDKQSPPVEDSGAGGAETL